MIKITSPSFSNNESLPVKFSCDGININPELAIKDIPEQTKSLALILEDPDAVRGVWTHWLLWNIDSRKNDIKERESPGIVGVNDYGNNKYDGPCPPSGIHRYFFKIYALDKTLGLPAKSGSKELYKAIEGHVIDQGELMATYSRQ